MEEELQPTRHHMLRIQSEDVIQEVQMNIVSTGFRHVKKIAYSSGAISREASVIIREVLQDHDLHVNVDRVSDALLEMTLALFDANFHLRKEHRGLFDREIELGNLLYFPMPGNLAEEEAILIREVMIRRMLDVSFFVAMPRPLIGRNDPQDESDAWDRSISFWVNLGFRRIGATDYFGYSPDPIHPCHSTPHDPSILGNLQRHALVILGETLSNDLSDVLLIFDDSVKQRREIIRMLANESDMDNIIPPIFYAAAYPGKAENRGKLIDFLCKELKMNPSCQDSYGNTPLHQALSCQNHSATKALLKYPSVLRDIFTRNMDGEIPLESHWKRRQERRIKMHIRGIPLGKFQLSQFQLEAVRDVMKIMEKMQPAKIRWKFDENRQKFGCSCGLCFQGWFSPRMQHRLRVIST
eukprot:TRINITY_DN3150_c7_g1_i1.p1 TRINITY_DN3150_c7_g1~~TRINITY_DN3150_c7_g1_i1.p1  ORF type:complete len:411 (+),score=94.27 TRINITY_DN3150_c7_g1_i1:50-1282(+)